MNSFSVILLGSLLACTNALRSTGSKDDVVYEEIGVKIEKIGKSISSDNEIMISIIVEFPNITRLGDVQALLSLSSMREKIDTCTDSSVHYKSVWDHNNAFFKKMADNFLNSRKALLKPFITPLNKTSEESTGRNKRGLLSFLGSLGLTLFMGGITEGQIYRLNKHIDSNRKEIDLLRHGILKQQAEIENLSEHVIGFMREFAMKIREVIETKESCSFFINQLHTRRRIQFVEWTKEVDDTLWTAIKGENSLLLTPRMLSLDKLETIVRRSRAFHGTIFENDPTYLYSLAKISLLEIEENLIFAHLVLIAPSVTEEGTVDIFKVEQVGAHIGGEMCIFHDLPQFVYKKQAQSEFYPITLDRCNKHNNLYVCPYEDFSNETACIQEKYNNCQLNRIKCPHTYQFVMSQIGILLRNNLEGQTFSSNSNGLFSSVKLSDYGTAYLYWKDLSTIQISNKKISSPKMEHIDLKMSNLSLDTDSLIHYLDSSNVTNVFKSICDKYNKSLSEIIDPAFDNWLNSDQAQWSNDWINVFILIVLSIALPGILFWLGYLHFSIHKVQDPEREDEIDESHISLIQLAPPRRASI